METFQADVGNKIVDEMDMQNRVHSQLATSSDGSTGQCVARSTADAGTTISTVPPVPSDVPGQSSYSRGQHAVIGRKEGLSGPQIPTVQSYMSSLSSMQGPSEGSSLSSIGGNPLLQTQHLSPNHSHSGQSRISNFYGASQPDTANDQQFAIPPSGSIGQPQLLHLQHQPSLSVGSGLIESSAASGQQKMLLSQPGLIHQPNGRPGDNSDGSTRNSYLRTSTLLPGGAAVTVNGIPHPHINARPAAPRWSGTHSTPKQWHSGDHADARENMNKKIVELLQQRRPNASTDWHQKLPQMARRLEEALYSDASSFDQYNNAQTLKGRLQKLALSMGRSASGGGSGVEKNSSVTAGSGDRASSQQAQKPTQLRAPNGQSSVSKPQAPQNGGSAHGVRALPTSAPRQPVGVPTYQMQSHGASQNRSMYHVNQAPSLHDRLQERSTTGTMSRIDAAPTAAAVAMQPSSQHTAPPRQFIKPNQINPILVQSVSSTGNSGGVNGRPDNIQTSASQKSIDIPREGGGGSVSSQISRYSQGVVPPSNSQHSDEHRRQVLKQQQQRLLLLRHASKCPHLENKCPVTPHCASMKQLWQHIMNCKDQECKVPHCVSSRYVLSHYSKCKESDCPVCGPVRDAIRKNYDKSRQILSISNSSTPHPASTPTDVAEKSESAPKRPRSKEAGTVPTKVPELDTVSCAIYSFTDQQIKSHIEHLQEGLNMKSSDVRDICLPLVDEMLKHHNGYIFASAVDPVALGIPDYPTIVKRPMDLGTVRKRLDNGYYRLVGECAEDVRLCFDNAMLYNPSHTEVHKCARVFKNNFERNLKLTTDARERELETKRLNPSACSLCGEVKLIFEPPNIYCNGKCNSQRIRRNSWYYTARNAYHWCVPCYNDLRDPIRLLNDGVLSKKELEKKKHNEEVEEFWVQCDQCQSWVHQICSLFNGRRNISEDMRFVCPLCILEQRKKHPERAIFPERKTRAADLPRSLLSDFIEKRVNECLNQCYAYQVEKYGVSVDQVEKAPAITVRQVSSIDQAHRVREGMFERYKHKNYPTEFPCRTKCVLLFQNLDGQDVILFGMYVYEYGHKCPQPNQRRVYVSYLDSVHYFRPRTYRTDVYHQILISYLEYVKERGFHTAHIWACPPMKGDDYIFSCHPQDQKTPKDDRLRLWYVKMLQKCRDRGIVDEVVDFHTEYLLDINNDATVMPYFEGDYWVGEAENIIKNCKNKDGSDDLEDSESEADDNDKVRSKRKKKKSQTKTRRVKSRLSRGTSGRPDRDVVMAKLSNIIEPMKEAFFVARLHPKQYADECALRRSREVAVESGNRRAVDVEMEKQRLQEEALSSGDVDSSSASSTVAKGKLVRGTDSSVAEMKDERNGEKSSAISDGKLSQSNDGEKAHASNVDAAAQVGIVKAENHAPMSEYRGDSRKSGSDTMSNASGSPIPEMAARDPSTANSSAATTEPVTAVKTAKPITDDTEDGDDTQDSEHFETRLNFLNLCQGNNYQFDQLRRAKHTSLMTLYHLHNPDAPKFMAVCSKCSSSILSGYRYHCETCDLDFCGKCYQQDGSKTHPHPLRPVSVGGAAIQLTEEQRRERQRSIALHLQLLQHASTCSAVECSSKNCQKMKEFLKHGLSCSVGFKKGCPVCKRVFNLLNLHARSCRLDGCTVLKCREIKEHMRKNATKQQQMDDRRRQMMNDIYRGGAAITSSNEG